MNSNLNNSGFDVKRNIIRKLSQQHYIPLATRQVFLKSFSAFPKTNYLWGEEDANDYFKSIENTYNFFKDITPTTDEHGRD